MNDQPLTVDFPLHARQGVAFTSPATEILYGGAAGGGKSHLMRAAGVLWCMQNPGLQVYLFRRLWPDLWLNHMQGETGFPTQLAQFSQHGYVRIVGKEIRFWNGSTIHLRHCQYEKTLGSYQGAEIHVLLIDEATHFTESMYRFLRARNRLGSYKPAMPGFPRIMLSANPGGIGHHWVKKTFVEPGPLTITKQSEEEGGMLRQFIPALSSDNPTLLLNDPGYMSRLAGLGDPVLVRAMQDGDWEVVAGAMFGIVWRRPRHVCRPFPIPAGWRIWRGMDDGFSAPAAIYWLTQNPLTETYYVIAEIYKTRMLPDDIYEAVFRQDRAIHIKQPDGEVELNDSRLSGILDNAAFAETGQTDPSRGHQMNAKGLNWTPVEKWDGSRVHRVQNFHRLLATNEKCPDGKPGIIFFDTCPHAIRTIPALPRDKNDIEDVDTDAEDHAFDAVTYAVQKPRPTKRSRRVVGM